MPALTPAVKDFPFSTLSDNSLTIFSIRSLSPATVSISPQTHKPYAIGSSSPAISSPCCMCGSIAPHLVLDLRITNLSVDSTSSGLVSGMIKLSRFLRLRIISWYSSGPVCSLCFGGRRPLLRFSMREDGGQAPLRATMNSVPSMFSRSQVTVAVLKMYTTA